MNTNNAPQENDKNASRRDALRTIARWSAATAIAGAAGLLAFRTIAGGECRIATACRDCHRAKTCGEPQAEHWRRERSSRES